MEMLAKILSVLGIVAALSVGAWFVFFNRAMPTETLPPYVLPELTQAYTNEAYQFSLKLPADFSVREVPDTGAGGATLVFENTKNEGIQILVMPFDEDVTVLSARRIKEDIPDMKVFDEQPVEIGQEHTGLAFRSDNKEFNGASREVWFVFEGNLYQISTYERLDPLLKAVFQTWKFL